MDLNFETKYEKMSVFNKKHKVFTKPTFATVDEDVTLGKLLAKMQSSKTYIFCFFTEKGKTIFLNEKIILKLTENYSINTKIKEIIK